MQVVCFLVVWAENLVTWSLLFILRPLSYDMKRATLCTVNIPGTLVCVSLETKGRSFCLSVFLVLWVG